MQPLYLVKVEVGENNNKYYRMTPNGSLFTAEWGRVGSNPQTMDYSISDWDKKLKEKLRKGYIDQTHLVAEITSKSKSKEYSSILNKSIAKIVERLQSMAKQAIEDNYTISSNKVTQKMIDEAQGLIDNRFSLDSTVDYFNEQLVGLFRIIPRKMKKVSDNIAQSKKDFSDIIQREQDLLDTMKGQVVQQSILSSDDNVDNNKQTILDTLGLQFFEVNKTEVEQIKSHLGSIDNKFHQAWKVINNKTQKEFDKFIKQNNIDNKKLLWHGSRNENWWSIINTGLILRPNAVITGKMFGDGLYFAPKASKSLGYTSLSGSYWAGGNSNSAFMSVYNVAYGKPFNAYSFEDKFKTFNYDKLQKTMQGANCLHVHEGSMLRNDEIIIYKEEQITIKYLVELKN